LGVGPLSWHTKKDFNKIEVIETSEILEVGKRKRKKNRPNNHVRKKLNFQKDVYSNIVTMTEK